MVTLLAVLGTVLAVAWAVSVVLAVAVPGPALGPGDEGEGTGAGADALVSVIVPMRDEVRNAAACLRAVLASRHRRLEVVVVDDHSRDGTADAVQAAADGDPRVRLVAAAPLPEGWVGKPWACAQGAAVAGGEWLVFCDADVRLAPEAIGVLVADGDRSGAQVVSWVGRQVLDSFWERVVNPVVFFFIASLTPLPLAQRPRSRLVAVNGQFLAFRREAYAHLGGHEAVADAVVEDLALGQAAKSAFGAGYRFVWTRDLLSTRMYRSFTEIRDGWAKNVALGADAVGLPASAAPLGALAGGLGPWLGTAAWLLGAAPASFAVAAMCQCVAIGWFLHRFSGEAPWWGLAAPLGTAVVTGIATLSWWRARRGTVRWRGRAYAARR